MRFLHLRFQPMQGIDNQLIFILCWNGGKNIIKCFSLWNHQLFIIQPRYTAN